MCFFASNAQVGPIIDSAPFVYLQKSKLYILNGSKTEVLSSVGETKMQQLFFLNMEALVLVIKQKIATAFGLAMTDHEGFGLKHNLKKQSQMNSS